MNYDALGTLMLHGDVVKPAYSEDDLRQKRWREVQQTICSFAIALILVIGIGSINGSLSLSCVEFTHIWKPVVLTTVVIAPFSFLVHGLAWVFTARAIIAIARCLDVNADLKRLKLERSRYTPV
jgi:hypothetical protein